ncbi:MAG: glycoside hydrolase family 38 C-terminal domain-containing protein [Candidatus Thorarchaeota archaeon]
MGIRRVIIVPHTHWDREWYLPFQRFRHMLVELVDILLRILEKQDYKFMLDGQTVILEDYFEIRPERKEELLRRIREGSITVGPWYVLPDQWLVGGESLIRNLEYSHDIAERLDIPLMKIGYLPDMFGHSRVIPQLLGDLTDFKVTVLWRGVPPEIVTVPFTWKSHPSSTSSVLCVYLPNGYGNASRFPEEYEQFQEMIENCISQLEPFSPLPVYLLMNGSDHLFPQAFVRGHVNRMKTAGLEVALGSLADYVNELEGAISDSDYTPPVYAGELRSSARAPLLQDTYSTRMWIKLWNQRVEDLLVRRAEPLHTYLWFALNSEYPTSYLETAWKWLLRNHPHDSICGCSVDITHEEMKARFSWAESIGESLVESAAKTIQETGQESGEPDILVFSSGGAQSPVYLEFSLPRNQRIGGLRATSGEVYPVQRLEPRDEIFFETTVGMRVAKMGIRLLPGRKLMDFYINEVEYHDGEKPGLLEVRFVADKHPVGDLDWEGFKREANELIASKRYKQVHLIASRQTQSAYAATILTEPWAFTRLTPMSGKPKPVTDELQVNNNHVSNRFYSVTFNRDGSLSLKNKESGVHYRRLHTFEDYGDRGDLYTFGRVSPEKCKVLRVKRQVLTSGPLVAEIRQEMTVEVFQGLKDSRDERVGKVTIPVESTFRFYHNTARIDVRTKLTNRARDHRLRVCFDLPFSSDTSLTSTHFGVHKREGAPREIPDAEELERTHSTFPELPSGVQPQKRFIRVDDSDGADAITIFNRGMPEVELSEGHRIALTLVRSVGWLSRTDIPERPINAGPEIETPEAQQYEREYEYRYGFVVHSKELPLHTSADNVESALDEPLTVTLNRTEIPDILLQPIIKIDNPAVRVSSLRVRKNTILVTLYNVESKDVRMHAVLADGITSVAQVMIDGTVKREHATEETTVDMVFTPCEIKMLMLKVRGRGGPSIKRP